MERILMKGNEALAEAAIRCGCKVFFGYPITPQTEVAAYFSKELPKQNGVYLQAESEIAAVNMMQGANAAGIRAMTSTSSPGLSLMTEAISYMAGADVPGVIVNVQRGGPGLGTIQPAQGDYWQATKAAGHGDFHIIVLAPGSVQEMADFVSLAFQLSETYRVPAMILSDGFLGQMMEPLILPEPQDPPAPGDWALTGHGGKRPHRIINSLYLDPDLLEASISARYERYETILEEEQRFEGCQLEDADIVITAFGAVARTAETAVHMAREAGIRVGLFRPITLWPFPSKGLQSLAATAKEFLCVEMNKGQMVDDVRLSLEGTRPVSFYGRCGGNIPQAEDIFEKLKEIAEGMRL